MQACRKDTAHHHADCLRRRRQAREILHNPLPPVAHHPFLPTNSPILLPLSRSTPRAQTCRRVPKADMVFGRRFRHNTSIQKATYPSTRCDKAMCGRFLLTAPKTQLAGLFQFAAPDDDGAALSPRFNIAPSQSIATVRKEQGDGRELAMVRWGLIP